MSTVIRVENVSKLYRLGEVGTGSLAHDLNRWWHKVRGNEDPYLKIGQVNDRERKAIGENAEKLKAEKLKEESRCADSKAIDGKTENLNRAERDRLEQSDSPAGGRPEGRIKTEKLKQESQGADSKASDGKTEKLKQDKDAAASQSPISEFQDFSLSAFSSDQDPSDSSSSEISAFQRFSVSAFSSDYVFALKDINFEVKQGEVLGIIGRNGAGKSTLLKILSRVTTPTTGQIKVKGRIASLLEVGTGFHPELTGRDNIFLNGAILGMRKAEIARKFDEIVDFSGCDRYIDTPVKRYSSGMYVRLAFAVAAHLEPEILIVDEVLAVGDAEFQKKCLGKMKDVAGQGRTVLFVSHNMGAINNLCSRAVMFDNGRIIFEGETCRVVEHYLKSGLVAAGELSWPIPGVAPGNDRVRLKAVRIVSESKITADVKLDQDCHIEIDYVNYADSLHLGASIHLLDKMGVEVLASANFHSTNLIRDEWFGRGFPQGTFRTVCTIPANFLNENHYSIRVAIVSNNSNIELLTGEIIGFNTHDTGEMRKEYAGYWLGVVKPKLAWQTERLVESSEANKL